MKFPVSDKHNDAYFISKNGDKFGFIRYVANQACKSKLISDLGPQENINLPIDNDNDIQQIINLMYNNKSKTEFNSENIDKMINVAKLLGFNNLNKKSIEWLKNDINSENVFQYNNLGKNLDLKEVSKLTDKWITEHPSEIVESMQWKKLDFEKMKEFSEKFNVLKSFDSYISWIGLDENRIQNNGKIIEDILDNTDLSLFPKNRLVELITHPCISENDKILNMFLSELKNKVSLYQNDKMKLDKFSGLTKINVPNNVETFKIIKAEHSSWDDAPEYHHDYSYMVKFKYSSNNVIVTIDIEYRSWGTYENRYEPYLTENINIDINDPNNNITDLNYDWVDLSFKDSKDNVEYDFYDNSLSNEHPLKFLFNIYSKYSENFEELCEKIYEI